MKKPVLTPEFCATNGILILRVEGEILYFAMRDNRDTVLKTRIKRAYSEYQCVFTEMDVNQFNLKLSQLFSEEKGREESREGDSSHDSRESVIDKVASDAPVVNLLNSIFLEALSKRASDIHIESGFRETTIRFRIDGLLVKVKEISEERALAVSARLKILANLNVLENRRPQDGHIDLKTDSYSLDVRISIVPSTWGESIVLRLLNRSDAPLSLQALGFSSLHAGHLLRLHTITSGLILVTGPTGSGKTTTLAAILKELNRGTSKILSIEDPVEYRMEGITQIQVNEELGLTFDALLRRILRQDPDIIMVGEIRDIETAELAVRAALSGHLVFATLHTNNALEAVTRLQNMGIPGYLVAAVLRMVIAQRLVRKICPVCHAAGCESCSQMGYLGRTVIAECIVCETEFSDLIARGAAIEELRSYLKRTQFATLFDDAEEKITQGITTGEEIRRELGDRR